MRVLTVAMTAMLVAACGGADSSSGSNNNQTGNPTPCTITASGAGTGTLDCGTPAAAYDSSKNQGSFGIGAGNSSSTNTALIIIAYPAAPHAGSVLKSTDAGAQGSFAVNLGGHYFSAVAGSTTASENQGSYTLNLSSVTTTASANGGSLYAVHGTLDATLLAVPSSGATGTVTLHTTF